MKDSEESEYIIRTYNCDCGNSHKFRLYKKSYVNYHFTCICGNKIIIKMGKGWLQDVETSMMKGFRID